jgi:hypothetical protein
MVQHLYAASHNVVLDTFRGRIGEPAIPVAFSIIMFAVTWTSIVAPTEYIGGV